EHALTFSRENVANYDAGQRKNCRIRLIEDCLTRAIRIAIVETSGEYEQSQKSNQRCVSDSDFSYFWININRGCPNYKRRDDDGGENGDESEIDQQIVLDHVFLSGLLG